MRPGFLLFSAICLLASCAKEYSLETGSGGTPATGILLKDANGDCTGVTVYGTYDAGVSLNETNYVEVAVTINKPGSYRISTDTQNGVSFADSGYFNVIGNYKLKLGGIGTPILPMTTDYMVTFDTTACGFSVNVSDDDGTTDPNLSATAWQFTAGANSYNGPVGEAAFTVEGGNDVFLISGQSANSTDTTFRLVVLLSTPQTLTAGDTYSTTSNADYLLEKVSTGEEIQAANVGNAGDGTNVTIRITAYNNTTRIAEGTFTGPVLTSAGAIVNVTNGRFKVRVAL